MDQQAMLAQALAYQQKGRHDEALGIYQQLLAAGNRDIPLLANCASALRAKGRPADAIKMLKRAADLAPKASEVWFNLANAYQANKQPVDAEQSLRRALQITPRFFPALFNLARLLAEDGRLEEAASHYQRALEAIPDHGQSWSNLGNVERRRERLDDSLRCHRKAIRLEPDNPDFWLNFGNALRDLSDTEGAADAYRTSLDLRPTFQAAMEQLIELCPDDIKWQEATCREFGDNPVYLLSLARRFAKQGEDDRALQILDASIDRFPEEPLLRARRGRELVRRQQLDLAIADLEIAVADSSLDTDAWCALGVARHQRGEIEQAHRAFHRALSIDPQNVEVLANLGFALSRERRIAEAMDVLRQAVALEPDHPLALQQLAVVLIDVGHSAEAEKTARHLMDLTSGLVSARRILSHALVQQGLVGEAQTVMAEAIRHADARDLDLHNAAFTSLYDDRHSAKSWRELHAEIGQRISVATSAATLSTCGGERLRIGYLSSDFRDHPVGYLVAPVLQHHDRGRFEVFAYHDAPSSDLVTQNIEQSVEHWRDVRGLSHDQVLGQIRADSLDLLLDLGGHTSGSRLPVFRGRAARLQVSWLGYPSTSGVPEIDHLLADHHLVRPGLERHYCEQIVRLDTFAFGWSRATDAPPPRPAPHENAGFVTFGCWNNIAKWSPRAIRLWSRILTAVPTARLSLRASALADEDNCNAIRSRFAEHGVDPGRILTHGPLRPIRDYLDAFGSVDALLDPVPYNGGATTLGALWQGVPVITLAGEFFMERMGASMLRHLDLPELVAHSDDEYVDIARQLAQTPDRLSTFRSAIPERMRRQPHRSPEDFTRHLESVLTRLVEQP